MRRRQRERRPAGNQATTQSLIKTNTSLPQTSHDEQALDLTERTRRHDYAVVVLAERVDGIVVSQVYQHLSAAERRVRRTHDRGLAASMHLVKLVPVPWTAGVDLALDHAIGGER